MIELVVDTRKISVRRREKLTAGSVGIKAQFDFSEDWTGLGRKAIFETDKEKITVEISSDQCVVPWELFTEEGLDVIVGVYGINADGSVVIPTVYTKIGRVERGADPMNASNTQLPTPNEREQIYAALRENTETVSAIKAAAERGDFDGEKGEKGDKGDAGARGDRGPTGVYIGDTAPTDPDVQIWYDTSAGAVPKYPKLPAKVKEAITALCATYRSASGRFKYHQITGANNLLGKAATRNDYASADTVLSGSSNRYKIQCALFAQLIWMGRSIDDFPVDRTKYEPKITLAEEFTDKHITDFGYYFDFILRKRVYGQYGYNDAGQKVYNGFIKPETDSYKGSYSYITAYTGAQDDPLSMGQTYTNFMNASEMARELYEMGCEIPFSELDVGDLVFFRAPNMVDGLSDTSEWMAFRHINHVAVVSRIRADGLPVFMEAVEAYETDPIQPEHIGQKYGTEPAANPWQLSRMSALMRWAVMCARHPMAFGYPSNVPDEITVIGKARTD